MDEPVVFRIGLDKLTARLSVRAVQLYKLAVEYPAWTRQQAERELGVGAVELEELITTLTDLLLLRPSLDPDREFTAVGPDTATAELLTAEENEIHRRRAVHQQLKRELLALQPTYFEARQTRRRSEAIDVIDDVGMVRHLLADQARKCERELHIAHPGSGMSEEGLSRSLALDLMMLDRGVVMHSVLQHSTRSHAPTQRYVAAVTAAGALVRTAPIVPRRIIVFDREVAFLPTASGDPADGAVLVREPAVLSHLLDSFDLLWHSGRQFPAERTEAAEDESEEAAEELTRAILRQMAAGAKDEVIARRLGISVRTCRRHIATLAADLGAQSRFQAGVLAEQRGLLD
ncbi:MAG TPA: helix-turn-helix transcriptional regulator [Kutzneria sp.]|jgi:DNA-binding CsgD family transcriptional regulator|nr:helix-turn-helix transcriptional regulator [Kutzneria sp.]